MIVLFACSKKQQELLGQFSSTVEQELHHYESRSNDQKIDLKFESKKQTK
jgi:hypothetical protein